ncbi:stage III sporulation protein AE [Clostridium thermarum]|uniref:stage III sporulation protein AE n=1 Tax=Clostridium thermarum TaxID=1716543 RepID=UPI001123120C|nr:stage III sporulation protein AE [Clostridium thermarum]
MKKIIMLLTLILVLVVPVRVYADEQHGFSVKDEEKIQSLYDYISNMKNKYEIINELDVQQYVDNFIETGDDGLTNRQIYKIILTYVLKELALSAKLMVIIVVIAVVAALLHNLQKAFSNESLSNIAYFACYSVLIIVVSKSFLVGLNLAKETILQMTDFMTALVPVLIMLVASVGGVTEAAVMNPIVVAGANIAARLYVTIIIPLIMIGFILQFVNNISEDYKISKLTKLINQWAIWIQGITMTLFIGILSIRGITSKTIDQVTVKTTKYMVDNFVPVVGKCLSDAISSVAGYSILLKNSLSALGLVLIIVIVAFPVIKLFIMAMLYKFTAAMIEPISDKKFVNSITTAGDSLILIMSCLVSVSVMFFVMVSILAATGKVVLT